MPNNMSEYANSGEFSPAANDTLEMSQYGNSSELKQGTIQRHTTSEVGFY